MADPISGMMNFSDIADDAAKMRRDAVAADTTSNMVSGMMTKNTGFDTSTLQDHGETSTVKGMGGFMPGIEGEGLSPDARARTYSETDDTRNFKNNEQLGSFRTAPPDTNRTADMGGPKLPMKTLDMPFIDREKLKGFPRPSGMSGGRMYQREI